MPLVRGPRPAARYVAALTALIALIATIALTGPAGPAGSAAPSTRYSVTPLQASGQEQAPKAATSSLAESDPALLRSTSSERVGMVVKLDYDSLSTYRGGVDGLEATSPAVTGGQLNRQSAAASAYSDYAAAKEDAFLSALPQASPTARAGHRLRTVYGGVAVQAPARDAAKIARLPGVVAVQADNARKLLTDASPEFIGAPTLYDQLGQTSADAGKGVIVGVLDTGLWPEHPSFEDQGLLTAPPPRSDGEPRVCNFGDNPLTPAPDVFGCQNKLIGGDVFLDTYLSLGLDEPYPDSARDTIGHGTHTASTAAGASVDDVDLLGVERGPIHGIAPGAWVSAYKVCGAEDSCFDTDSAAAVEQAVEDGVSVINFSISGGTNPLTDVVELAFLDAYQAGVFVATSAGNDGPGAATVNHLSPWVASVAASTQQRAFLSSLTLQSGADSLQLSGASVTDGVETPAPLVHASAAPYGDALCQTPAPAGTFTGKVVACERGVNARVDKGFNVLAGGALGMILYNPEPLDTETDNHWLPTVHLEGPQGDQLLAFLDAHPDTTASFTPGEKAEGQGDVMAGFSSRGPGGPTIKPDITAPGVSILAGHSPTPYTTTEGPPGQFFQAIAGTSMSSPHVAGSALLLKALHPDWSPGQVKSALMTTATRSLVKEDMTTPADPFDFGAGRTDLNVAGDPGLTFSDDGIRMAALYADPAHAIDINVPSVNAPVMPGWVRTTRKAVNVTDETMSFSVSSTTPTGSNLRVLPSTFTVDPGEEISLDIRIWAARLAPGQYFGSIELTQTGGPRELHLPVAFNRTQGTVSLASTCAPNTVDVGGASTCTVQATNNSYGNTAVDLRSRSNSTLPIASASGGGVVKVDDHFVRAPTTDLDGKTPAIPAIAPGATPGPGYLDLEDFDVPADPMGDEDLFVFDTPAWVYGGDTYTSIGFTSNGYAVAGGGTAEDVAFEPQTLPDAARPNNVLAAFWTDLNGDGGAEGLRVAVLEDDTGAAWMVAQWDIFLYGTTTPVAAQIWIGLNGTEDISYAYGGPQPDPGVSGLTVGAENINGSAGAQVDPAQALLGEDLRVTTSGALPGESLVYTVVVNGASTGVGELTSIVSSPVVPGTTVVRAGVRIR